MQSEIKRWGNSAAVRLSSKILAQAKLDVSSPISIDVKAGKIVIEAIEKAHAFARCVSESQRAISCCKADHENVARIQGKR